jgi:hypothetical protein
MGTNGKKSQIVRMSQIIREKIDAHKALITRARASGNAEAVKRANARIRQLKLDLAREQAREARAA